MGCCLVWILAAVWPRVTLAVIWLFANDIPRAAFKGQVWPVVGFIFLPATTLAYEICKARLGGIDSPLCLTLLGLAFLHDLGHFGAFRRRRLKKEPAAERRAKFVDSE